MLRVIFGNYICNQLNLAILKIGVLPYNEKIKFWTCALIAPSPSIIIIGDSVLTKKVQQIVLYSYNNIYLLYIPLLYIIVNKYNYNNYYYSFSIVFMFVI